MSGRGCGGGDEVPGFLFANLAIAWFECRRELSFSFLCIAIFFARSGLDDRGVRVSSPCLKGPASYGLAADIIQPQSPVPLSRRIRIIFKVKGENNDS